MPCNIKLWQHLIYFYLCVCVCVCVYIHTHKFSRDTIEHVVQTVVDGFLEMWIAFLHSLIYPCSFLEPYHIYSSLSEFMFSLIIGSWFPSFLLFVLYFSCCSSSWTTCTLPYFFSLILVFWLPIKKNINIFSPR